MIKCSLNKRKIQIDCLKTFTQIFDQFDWDIVRESIFCKTTVDVEAALYKKTKRTLEDFKALISPSAEKYLEEMAGLSHHLTQKRFGKTIQLYAPLYLSNECQNVCSYCAFSYDNKIKRVTLNEADLKAEIAILKKMGFDHILIVTGEFSSKVGMDYFLNVLSIVRPHFSHISFEVQPLATGEYRELIRNGLNTVLVYQETYNREHYKMFHPKGRKSNFNFRLETPDRLGNAGIYKIGIGILLGLEVQGREAGWRTDSFFCALHLDYLEKTFWQTKYSISFPRLRPIEIAEPLSQGIKYEKSVFKTFDTRVSDRELVQLICAYRIFNAEVELSLSTRESEDFRNNILKLGITSMSAGSKTNPGGYSVEKTSVPGNVKSSLEQFEISDERSPGEISAMLQQNGYETVWKDWDKSLQ